MKQCQVVIDLQFVKKSGAMNVYSKRQHSGSVFSQRMGMSGESLGGGSEVSAVFQFLHMAVAPNMYM